MHRRKLISHGSDTHRHPILEVPPEIWEQVATLSGRQAIARLCAVSHTFYSRISPLLYGTTNYPPLTSSQSTLLTRTIGKVRASVHPIHAIKIVSFSGNSKQCRDALWNLADISSPGQPIRGALLRSLEWNLPETAGLRILLAPGYFPNLKRVSVCATVNKSETGFDFVRIPGLDKLEFSLRFITGKKPNPCGRSLAALGKALALLPVSSPLLQTLKFGINIQLARYTGDDNAMMCLWDAFSKLVKKTNEMCFSALTSVELSVKPSIFFGKQYVPRATFMPLLLGNPSLRDILVDVEDMDMQIRIPLQLNAGCPANLRRLRSFTGSVEQCAAVVSAHTPGLEHLHMLGDAGKNAQFTSTRFPPNVGPTIRRLTVRTGENIYDEPPDFAGFLRPRSLGCLVLAFPNVTQLNVSLDPESKISAYSDSFAALSRLEYLRVYRAIYLDGEHWDEPPTVIFPAQQYAAKINEMRPFLPQLLEVQMFLLGYRVGSMVDVGCP
ncbi:hypothetical protein DFH06DRAFT_366322 [Mycena polygramma]|nr:hypothetical protein DFH06DRAFT_366322 [Mycena polygramma]